VIKSNVQNAVGKDTSIFLKIDGILVASVVIIVLY